MGSSQEKRGCWLFGEMSAKGVYRQNAQMEVLNIAQPAKQGYCYYNIVFKIRR